VTWSRLSASEDAALVQKACQGESVAFALLYSRYERRLLARCGRLLHDALLAQEIAQQAALEALVGLPRLANPERFGVWLLAIATHLCRHYVNSPVRRVSSLDALREAGRFDEPPAPEPALDMRIEAIERAHTLDLALERLPLGQREAVALFYLHGLSLAETAKLLGVEVGAVKSRLHKARSTLRRRLGNP
jgi:RNA polymerase sigma-70 factor (ECF subfamily)